MATKKKTTAAREGVRRRRRRKMAISLNTGLALALAAILLGMVNYLSYRHYRRADWSRTKYYELSDKTRSLLADLTNEVKVVVFVPQTSDVYDDVKNLLEEYKYLSPRIHSEFVDPHRDLARTKQLAAKYDVDLLDAGVVVFDAQGRTKYVKENDMVEKDFSFAQPGQPPTRVAFKGEQAFSSAIQSVTQEEKPVVYFLGGHGERNTDSFEPFEGYSDLAQSIRRDNIELKNLTLGQTPDIPDDADALVVAGPAKKLSQLEVDVLRKYLEASGRMIVLLDAATRTGLEPLLEDWGVGVENDVVVDPARTLTGRELFITDYGTHPITRGFRGVTCVMYFPRSVGPLEHEEEGKDPADVPRVTLLAQSSETGWAESDLDENPMAFDPGVDRPGPVGVAVAVERGPGPGIDVQIRSTRLVVFGDSDFLANGVASGGNVDLFMSSLNWMLERNALLAIAPKPVQQLRLVMTGGQLKLLFWAIVVGLPLAVGILGGLVWARRRA